MTNKNNLYTTHLNIKVIYFTIFEFNEVELNSGKKK